jgi:HEPN domain-containing protein
MSAGSDSASAADWLAYAAEDLGAARGIVEGGSGVPRHACFFAQQAAEKALKAVLIAHGLRYPKVHDLERLLGLQPAGFALGVAVPELAKLTDLAVDARYPGLSPTWPEAEEALTTAEAVVAAVTAHLAAHGIEP